MQGAKWTPDDIGFLAAADELDRPDPTLGYETQLYNLDAVAYESLMLGVFAIHKGPPNEICLKEGTPKITDLILGFSRDGIHWDRPEHGIFGVLTEAGHMELRLSALKRWGMPGHGRRTAFLLRCILRNFTRLGGHMYAGGSTGLATLRRDGFASMDADGAGGTLTTKLLRFNGTNLFVNARADNGELRVEAIGQDGQTIQPFTVANCRGLKADSCRQRVFWNNAADVSALRGRPVQFRFYLTKAQLYSFWVSPATSVQAMVSLARGAQVLLGSETPPDVSFIRFTRSTMPAIGLAKFCGRFAASTLLFAVSVVPAQNPTAKIAGTVSDQTGAPIPTASLLLINTETQV